MSDGIPAELGYDQTDLPAERANETPSPTDADHEHLEGQNGCCVICSRDMSDVSERPSATD